jgi:transposase InsO family protein
MQLCLQKVLPWTAKKKGINQKNRRSGFCYLNLIISSTHYKHPEGFLLLILPDALQYGVFPAYAPIRHL